MNNYLTFEAINKLHEELNFRLNVRRFEINQELKEARAHGDLSENYEYKAAKTERARNNGRMNYLNKMIKTAHLIKDETKEDEVGLNKLVTLYFIDFNEADEFHIVTTIESDPINNKISIESPIGKAIYGHKVDEVVSVTSPDGDYALKITKIEKEGV